MPTFKKILFIEDEVFISELYTTVLRENGFEVTCAFDGESGLELALSQQFDVILLDVMLPAKSGPEVLMTLRDAAASPTFDQSTVIIVLTNFEEDERTKKELLNLSQAYLLKVNIMPRALVKILRDLENGIAPPPQA